MDYYIYAEPFECNLSFHRLLHYTLRRTLLGTKAGKYIDHNASSSPTPDATLSSQSKHAPSVS